MVFCRGCGNELHESAATCPHCGAPQSVPLNKSKASFSSYKQVPWYRKNWFAFVCFFLFAPGLLIVLFTGDVYYESKGELKTYSKAAKISIVVWSILVLGKVIFRS